MQVYEELRGVQLDADSALTFGAFDGVHLGHQQVIHQVVEAARAAEQQSVVFSFYPHPKRFVDPENCPPSLTSREKKIALIQSLGADVLLLVKLEPWLSQLSPQAFIAQITHEQLRARHIIVGYDSEFGYKRQGNPSLLRQIGHDLGIKVGVVPPQDVCGDRVSSTGIREALAAADLKVAARMLGRNHSVCGEVVLGQQLGRTLGFPTANIDTSDQMLPAHGVYTVWAHWDSHTYPAVLNIGKRPTFDGMALQLEAHLIGFSGDLYGVQMEIEFVQHLRNERRFANADALVAQIREDCTAAMQALQA